MRYDRQVAGVVPITPVFWMGSSRAELEAFPEPVQSNVGYALFGASSSISPHAVGQSVAFAWNLRFVCDQQCASATPGPSHVFERRPDFEHQCRRSGGVYRGSVKIESVAGNGTRVEVRLPLGRRNDSRLASECRALFHGIGERAGVFPHAVVARHDGDQLRRFGNDLGRRQMDGIERPNRLGRKRTLHARENRVRHTDDIRPALEHAQRADRGPFVRA